MQFKYYIIVSWPLTLFLLVSFSRQGVSPVKMSCIRYCLVVWCSLPHSLWSSFLNFPCEMVICLAVKLPSGAIIIKSVLKTFILSRNWWLGGIFLCLCKIWRKDISKLVWFHFSFIIIAIEVVWGQLLKWHISGSVDWCNVVVSSVNKIVMSLCWIALWVYWAELLRESVGHWLTPFAC